LYKYLTWLLLLLMLPFYCFLQPCGGAIPLCMVQEFDLPQEIIDRKVRRVPASSNARATPRTL
jgi:hypothetical protein